MTPETELKPLPHIHRRIVFICAVVLFALLVPVLVMYAIGYRFDPSSQVVNLKGVGGMYVSSQADGVTMYINDELVENMRLFRSAAYIQNLDEGVHQIHVQGPGVQTWTKQLPVFAHFVTEADSFNVPLVPQVRLIPQWINSGGSTVLVQEATSSLFTFASHTSPYIVSTTTSTSTLIQNIEHLYVEELFASSSALRNELSRIQQIREGARFTFGSTPMQPAASSTATTTVQRDDIRLFEKGGEVYAQWIGGTNKDVPYYFCLTYLGPEETALQYGEHVYESLFAQLADNIDITDKSLVGARLCRDTIRIDRLQQEVLWFDFFPNNSNIVLMQLQDGLYAVEIDDRAWQNTQRLYPGDSFQTTVDGNRIFLQDDSYYLELYTEIAG